MLDRETAGDNDLDIAEWVRVLCAAAVTTIVASVRIDDDVVLQGQASEVAARSSSTLNCCGIEIGCDDDSFELRNGGRNRGMERELTLAWCPEVADVGWRSEAVVCGCGWFHFGRVGGRGRGRGR